MWLSKLIITVTKILPTITKKFCVGVFCENITMKLNIVSFITFCQSQPTPFGWSTILNLHNLKLVAILNTMLQSERHTELCTWKSFVFNLLWRLPECSLFNTTYKLLFNTDMLYYRFSSLHLQSWYKKYIFQFHLLCNCTVVETGCWPTLCQWLCFRDWEHFQLVQRVCQILQSS